MQITLPTEPFIITFNLTNVVRLDKKQDVYKFLISFTHHDNEEITFSLPKGYQTYLHTNDIARLINVLSTKIHQLKEHSNDKEVCLDFEKNYFVNLESDIGIIVDSGEYYIDENDGLLHLMFFFNINVSYKESGTTNIGFEAHVNLSAIKNFINALESLIQ